MKIKIIDDCISLEKQNNIIKESLKNTIEWTLNRKEWLKI